MPPTLDLALCAHLACLWEVTARKPGNVHRYRDFHDTSFLDFAQSAAAIAPVLARSAEVGVAATVLACVRARAGVTRVNTNLGIALLLAPLAANFARGGDQATLRDLLDRLDREDSALVCQAIREAMPGGLGRVEQGDVFSPPELALRPLMALAADRDSIARQYAEGFSGIFEEAVPAIAAGIDASGSLEGGIILGHLQLMARFPDSLIRRKRGDAVEQESARRAEAVLAAGWPHSEVGKREWADFDAWLRADGNARNPGTTADLVAAALFVLLCRGEIALPLTLPWSCPEGGA